MDTDSIVGATAGLLGVAIMANVAGNVLKGTSKSLKVAKKKSPSSKSSKIKW